MKILIINGPNLNILGKRESSHYGSLTLDAINKLLEARSKKLEASLTFFQSNHEGELIDFLQKESKKAHGILINPAALTHYGYSLRDALADTKLPIVEVHLSDIMNREDYRKIDVLDGIVLERIVGRKEKGYVEGLELLIKYLHNK